MCVCVRACERIVLLSCRLSYAENAKHSTAEFGRFASHRLCVRVHNTQTRCGSMESKPQIEDKRQTNLHMHETQTHTHTTVHQDRSDNVADTKYLLNERSLTELLNVSHSGLCFACTVCHQQHQIFCEPKFGEEPTQKSFAALHLSVCRTLAHKRNQDVGNASDFVRYLQFWWRRPSYGRDTWSTPSHTHTHIAHTMPHVIPLKETARSHLLTVVDVLSALQTNIRSKCMSTLPSVRSDKWWKPSDSPK